MPHTVLAGNFTYLLAVIHFCAAASIYLNIVDSYDGRFSWTPCMAAVEAKQLTYHAAKGRFPSGGSPNLRPRTR